MTNIDLKESVVPIAPDFERFVAMIGLEADGRCAYEADACLKRSLSGNVSGPFRVNSYRIPVAASGQKRTCEGRRERCCR